MIVTSNNKIAYAKVEQPFGVEPPIMHCPICGTALVDKDGSTQPCPHLAFVYVREMGGFDYQSAAFQDTWKAINAVALDFDTFRQYLLQVQQENTLLAIEITYGGAECGPVWYTDIYGFDYKTLTQLT